MDSEKQQNNPDFILLTACLILLGFGLMMIMSASSIRAYSVYGDPLFFFRRQLIYAGIGLVSLLLFSRIDYHLFFRHSKKILVLAIVLLVLVLLPDVGRKVGGSRRWLTFYFFNFQPSEFAKLAVVIYLAGFIKRKGEKITSFKEGLMPALLVVLGFFFLIVSQPDLGTALNIFGVAIFLLILGGVLLRHLFLLTLPGAAFLFYYINSAHYRLLRVQTFFDPWTDPRGTGYHIIQSLFAFGSGGLTGVGPGNSRQKFLYLPEPGTDFIFAIIGEEFGLIGALLVLFLFAVIAYRGTVITLTAPDIFGSLLAAGVTAMIIIQALINIGAVTSLIPVTGITLPFISYGGSSLIISLTSIGILLNISRQAE